MSTKRIMKIILVASVLMLVLGFSPRVANIARALPPAQSDMTIPYSGNLTGEAGQPVADGAYDFTFALYEAESSGKPLWTESQGEVMVQEGNFTVLLGSVNPLPEAVLDEGSARWLEVGVLGLGETEFTWLSPRQVLKAAEPEAPASPSANSSCAHDHIGEVWSGSVDWSNSAFRVNNSGNGPSIWGWNTGGGNGIRGDAYGSGLGVYGEGENGSGVVGRSANTFGVQAEGGGDSSTTDGVGDLALGGDLGEIFATGSGSSMDLYSNYEIRVHLDFDNNSADEWFRVFNGAGSDVFHVTQDGAIVAAGSKAGYVVDVAQNDDVVSLELGDVVVISGAGPAVLGKNPLIKVRLSAAEGTSAVIGVVDKRYVPAPTHGEKPDLKTSGPDYDEAAIAPGEYLTVVTLGSFQAIKVDASYDAIAPGDLLVASPNPGYAMRAASPAPGTIIGKALGALESGTGIIPVIITLQ